MSQATNKITVDNAREYLASLNLDYIVDSMCAENYSLPRWTRDDAIKCCQIYKNFLLLQKIHLPTPLVPTRQIDEFWHNHILYTKNYFNDCDHIFGHYLHHEPAALSDDNSQLVDAFVKTKSLYLNEFGEML